MKEEMILTYDISNSVPIILIIGRWFTVMTNSKIILFYSHGHIQTPLSEKYLQNGFLLYQIFGEC